MNPSDKPGGKLGMSTGRSRLPRANKSAASSKPAPPKSKLAQRMESAGKAKPKPKAKSPRLQS